jgi:hypothetical protein
MTPGTRSTASLLIFAPCIAVSRLSVHGAES